MRKNYDIRLAALREYLKSLSADETTFIVEGGAEYHTKEDPFNYLMQHGAVTHDGRRIVLYPHPVEGIDGLSLADRFNGAARCNTRRGVRRHHGRRHRFIPRCAAGAVPCGP